MKCLIILASGLFSSVSVFGEDTYLDTLVKLRVPKKESKRSTEGGLEHVLFRICLTLNLPIRSLV